MAEMTIRERNKKDDKQRTKMEDMILPFQMYGKKASGTFRLDVPQASMCHKLVLLKCKIIDITLCSSNASMMTLKVVY